jgi:hypothetical protein
MKRHNNLYPRICDPANIALAHKNARKHKTHYHEVRMVDSAPDLYLGRIHEMLIENRFQNSPYTIFIKRGRKDRTIYRLPYFPDRIVHHAVVQVLEPIWMKMFVRDTYSTIKGRGIHDGVRRMKKFLRDEEGTRYCLKLDVKKFYPSINHDHLKRILRGHIKCRPTLALMDTIIDSCDGVPIGNYLSQYFANVYLSPFDHFVKEDLRVKYYARYCDDIVLLDRSAEKLHLAKRAIEAYLCRYLSLTVKENWQVFPTRIRGIDFLGYRFFGNRTMVRKYIVRNMAHKLNIIRRKWQTMPHEAVIHSVMSYYGWLVHADAHGLWDHLVTDDIRNIMDTVCRTHHLKNPLSALEAT